MARVILDLDGEEAAVVRLLKRLLKVLGRAYGVRCRSVRSDGEVKAIDE